MVRKVLAASVLTAALATVALGMAAELESRNVNEPTFETGVIIGAALIVASFFAVAAYLLWPKSN